MGDENPIRTLGDYSKPSNEGYRNNIKLPVGNNVVPLRSDPIRKLRNKYADESWETIENLALYDHEGWSDTKGFAKPFKQREDINGRMTKMFKLLMELISRAPKKVLIRKEAKSLVTKSVNSISLIREKKEKNNIYDVATGDDGKETDGPNMEVSVKEAETKNSAKNKAKNKPIKKLKKEEVVESISSQPVEYYLKHRINENLTEGLVDNNRFNDSLLGARVRKKKGKTYNVLPRGPVYEVILKKKDKKEGGH
nr:hypothetical protein [Tanacetum cinerariifolium]